MPAVLAALGRVQLGGPGPSAAQLASWQQAMALMPSRVMQPMLHTQLLSLRRLLGEDPATLLVELDAMITKLSSPGTLMRPGFWARVERLRVYEKMHDPGLKQKVETERAALISDATARGYLLVAQRAAATGH